MFYSTWFVFLYNHISFLNITLLFYMYNWEHAKLTVTVKHNEHLGDLSGAVRVLSHPYISRPSKIFTSNYKLFSQNEFLKTVYIVYSRTLCQFNFIITSSETRFGFNLQNYISIHTSAISRQKCDSLLHKKKGKKMVLLPT